MKLKIGLIVYILYLKGSRFIAYFKDPKEAMRYGEALYPTEEKHVEPIFVLEEDKNAEGSASGSGVSG